MPVYEFRNKETGETFDKILHVNEREAFLAENPNIEQVHLTPMGMAVVDPARIGLKKAPAGFKEVLRNIHQRTPGSELNKVADV